MATFEVELEGRLEIEEKPAGSSNGAIAKITTDDNVTIVLCDWLCGTVCNAVKASDACSSKLRDDGHLYWLDQKVRIKIETI